jgi:hypothetical protein
MSENSQKILPDLLPSDILQALDDLSQKRIPLTHIFRSSAEEIRKLRKLVALNEWQPISTAPKYGLLVDLWIIGPRDEVKFYCQDATMIGKAGAKPSTLWHGRAGGFRWGVKPPNAPNWYPDHGLGYPLAPAVTATHWRPPPGPPSVVPSDVD